MMILFCDVIAKKPSTIHVEWIRLWPIDYLFYWICNNILKVKLVYTVHNVLPHNHKSSDVPHYRKLYSLMDKLIVHTESSKRDLIEIFPEIKESRIEVIPHGILQLRVDNDGVEIAKQKLLKTHGMNNKTVIAIIGTQSKYKGTDLLLEAWKTSRELSKDDSICLFAMGKFANDIKLDDLPENIIIDNRLVSDEEFIAAMKIASVIMLPYRKIDQSGVLLTVFNEHVPYCATNVGELCKPFEIANIGWPIPSATEDDIKEVLLYLSAHREEMLAKRADIESWNKISGLYSWPKISEKTEKLYDK